MARIRTIKPEFPADEKLAKVSRDARLTFVLLMTQADDEGLILALPRQLLGLLYPFDEEVTPEILRTWIDELVAAEERVRWRQTTGGAPVLEIPNWKKHQKIDKPTPSKIRPSLAPLASESPNESREPRGELANSPPIEAEAEREVGSGEGSGAGSGSALDEEFSTADVDNPGTIPANDPPSAHADSNDEPQDEPHELKPREAVLMSFAVRRFLDQFYPASDAKRRTDIENQLIAALSPKGATIRKGEGVAKAYDLSHLEQCCAQVKAEDVRVKDKAILVLLPKLRDTWGETRAAREKAARNEDMERSCRGPERIGKIVDSLRQVAL